MKNNKINFLTNAEMLKTEESQILGLIANHDNDR